MLRSLFSALALVAVVGAGARAADDPPGDSKKAATPAKAGDEEVAVIETNHGNIVVRFYDDAPKTVANFKKLARDKFYDGTTFHRVVPGFVIQGGDPNSKDSDRSNDGQGGPGYTVAAEIKHKHTRGALATARLPDQVNPKKESSGSQFYIALKPLPQLDGNYTVFGEVLDGMDVVDKIAAVRRDSRDNPVESVVMKKVTVIKRSALPKTEKSDKSKAGDVAEESKKTGS